MSLLEVPSNHIGIVGHDATKFTAWSHRVAVSIIRELLQPGSVCVSGRCPNGGIDVWAEEIADELGREKLIFPPAVHRWRDGYKLRDIQIAQNSAEVHVIVVDKLPEGYTGMRFPSCYHCRTTTHVKSGGCWTAKFAQQMGRKAQWHVIHSGEGNAVTHGEG